MSDAVVTANKAIDRVTKESAADSNLRFVRSIQVGEHVRQGDLYIERIETAEMGVETKDRQLVPGTTKGSRHAIDGDASIYTPIGNDPLVGPTIVASDRFAVTHPEHAHFSLPAGTYRCQYQRDFSREERARQMD